MHLKVSNKYITGRTLMQISEFLNRDVVCTRILHDGEVITPNRDSVLALDDEILLVCAESDAEAIQAFIGPLIEGPIEIEEDKQPMISRRIIVTNPKMNGKTLQYSCLGNFMDRGDWQATVQGLQRV